MTNYDDMRAQAAEAFPDEVVTKALVRMVDLPAGEGKIALITLENGFDHKKPTTFGPQGLVNLQEALDTVEAAANAGEIKAVAVTGKPFIFAVGADLKMVSAGNSRDDAMVVAKAGHDQFRRLGELSVPSFAYVNGAVMGGGLEIALHCTYRSISSGVGHLALPECFLGLVPGWGGTYLLPNLIGPQKALELIITNAMNQNKMINGKKAHDMGIADVIFEPADFLAQSMLWTADVLAGRASVERAEVDKDEAKWEQAVAQAKFFVDAKVSGAAPAPYKALELVSLARTADRDTAFAAEDEALSDLAMSEELRSGVYAFDLVSKYARKPAGKPTTAARPVAKVGIVGAGLMASQLALLFVRRLKVPVIMTDLDQERVDKGVAYVHDELNKLHAKGRLSQDALNRLTALVTGSVDKSVFSDADVVIEAVFEEMGVKQKVFAELEEIIKPECVLMTNTSSLSVTEMASKLKHPERVVGFHFFNPVAVLPLVEVIKAEKTDDETLATAFEVGKKLKKTCVMSADYRGFVVNRLLTRFMGEVQKAVDAGTNPTDADNALKPLGLPMTPSALLTLVGPAIALHVAEVMHEAYPDRFSVSENMKGLVASGETQLWTFADGKMVPNPSLAEVLSFGDSPYTEQEVLDRACEALAEEIKIMLDEGVVSAPEDIDLCMIMGAGWPFHLGGVTPYLDRNGYSEKVNGKRFLEKGIASLPA